MQLLLLLFALPLHVRDLPSGFAPISWRSLHSTVNMSQTF